jgi:hypothetical protein
LTLPTRVYRDRVLRDPRSPKRVCCAANRMRKARQSG